MSLPLVAESHVLAVFPLSIDFCHSKCVKAICGILYILYFHRNMNLLT
jgi:hypothetical protein